jgi:diguanylate cyclase (GGDEF)-like protein
MYQLTIWSLPSFAAIVLALHALLRVRRGGDVPGAGAMVALCGCVVLWASGQLLGSLTTDLELKIAASKLQYPGIALLPVAWLTFALIYVRRMRTLGVRSLVMLTLIPAVTIILAWSNELHQLVWIDVRLDVVPGFVGMSLDYGIWFDIQLLYSYALISGGTFVLIYELSASPHHRRALVSVMLAPGIVIFLNVMHLSEWDPLPFIDLTPLGLALGTIVFTRAVLHTGLLDVSPTLHREVLEELADGVLILDAGHRVVDANSAAREMLDVGDGSTVESSVARLLDGEQLDRTDDQGVSWEIAIGSHTYDVRATRLDPGSAAKQPKTALVFRDVTERLQAESELRLVKQQMEHLAYTDSLTELPNRRYFMQRLKEETARLRRSASVLSVVVLDLDRFKDVNDTYGHDTGDRVLCVVAGIMKGCSRDCDVAARLGGEEFALLLPDTGPEDARRVAERLRTAIAAHAITHTPGVAFFVTTSAGVATARCTDWNDLLKLADQALYRAKHSGRNAVAS